jgi:hypothetical protein
MQVSPKLALSVEVRKGRRKLERVRDLLRELPNPVLVFYEGAHVKAQPVRSVIHYQAPGSLEQYFREASLASDAAVLLFDPADLVIHHRRGMRKGDFDRVPLQEIESYARTADCRVRFIRRRLFGETDVPRCGICDRCKLLFVEAHHPDHR